MDALLRRVKHGINEASSDLHRSVEIARLKALHALESEANRIGEDRQIPQQAIAELELLLAIRRHLMSELRAFALNDRSLSPADLPILDALQSDVERVSAAIAELAAQGEVKQKKMPLPHTTLSAPWRESGHPRSSLSPCGGSPDGLETLLRRTQKSSKVFVSANPVENPVGAGATLSLISPPYQPPTDTQYKRVSTLIASAPPIKDG